MFTLLTTIITVMIIYIKIWITILKVSFLYSLSEKIAHDQSIEFFFHLFQSTQKKGYGRKKII